MNIIDIALWGVLGIAVLFGLYSGFLGSLFNTVGMFLSYFFSWLFYPQLAKWFQGHEDWVAQLVHYTEGAARIPTLEMARANVAQLQPEQIVGIVEQAAFPEPFGKLLEQNIAARALAQEGASTLADYFNNTVVMVSINLLSFALLFALLYIGFSIAIAATGYTVRLPVLRHADWAAGALVGLGRGVMLALILCSLLPVVLAILPGDIALINDILDGSGLLPFFLNNNPILDMIRGVVG